MVNRSIGKPPCLGKLKNYEDEDDCSTDFETEFPAIVLYSTLTAIHSEPTVYPPNDDEVDFRISLDESNNEDYTVIFDENSFSYKIISVNDLKMDSGSDKPLSPNPTVDYFDDLDYFKDFKNEFPAVVYNDGLTFKSDLEIKPLVSSEHINEFNLINEASLSEYDEEIVSRFNVLFNIVHLDDSQLEKDNDDNDIGIIQSSEVLFFLILNLYVPSGIPFNPKRYYKDSSHITVAEAKVFMSYAWRRRFRIRAPLVREFILEFLSTCRMSDIEMGLDVVDTLCFQLGGVRRMMTWRYDILIPDKGDLRDYWIEISSDRNFLGPAPSYVLIRGPVRRLCHKMIAYSVFGRGQAPEKNQDWYQTITLTPNQILTKELSPDMKQWEELIQENVFGLGGYQDHLPACLAHMLYCVVAEENYNLYILHLVMAIYDIVDRVMRPFALKPNLEDLNSDRGKARHSVSSLSSNHHGMSSHQHDDDDDVETSCVSIPSPTTYLP
ncbi:hypothetical protein Tco_1244090 [Tanacetum coccineum]